jgi:hypothetical protein
MAHQNSAACQGTSAHCPCARPMTVRASSTSSTDPAYSGKRVDVTASGGGGLLARARRTPRSSVSPS